MADDKGALSIADAVEEVLTDSQESEPAEAETPEDNPPEAETEEPAESAEADATEDDSEEPDEESDESDGDEDEQEIYRIQDDETIIIDDEELTGAELKSRMLMQADYTAKTQQLAQERKQVGETVSALQKERESVAELMPRVRGHEQALQTVFQMGQQLHEALGTMSQEQQRIAQPILQALGQARQQADANIKAAGQFMEKAKAEQTTESLRQLKIRNPKWGPDIYAKVKNHAVDHLTFSGDQIDQVTDWRLLQALNDSMELQAIKAKAKTAPKAKDPAPLKSKRRKGSVSGSQRKVQDAAKRASAARGVHDQIDAFADLLVTEAQSKRR